MILQVFLKEYSCSSSSMFKVALELCGFIDPEIGLVFQKSAFPEWIFPFTQAGDRFQLFYSYAI